MIGDQCRVEGRPLQTWAKEGLGSSANAENWTKHNNNCNIFLFNLKIFYDFKFYTKNWNFFDTFIVKNLYDNKNNYAE